jgi:hypothetical protein
MPADELQLPFLGLLRTYWSYYKKKRKPNWFAFLKHFLITLNINSYSLHFYNPFAF